MRLYGDTEKTVRQDVVMLLVRAVYAFAASSDQYMVERSMLFEMGKKGYPILEIDYVKGVFHVYSYENVPADCVTLAATQLQTDEETVRMLLRLAQSGRGAPVPYDDTNPTIEVEAVPTTEVETVTEEGQGCN